jgi:competence protein ComEC
VLTCGFVAALVGIGWACVMPSPATGWLLLAGIIVLLSLRRLRVAALYSLIVFGFLLGWWRGTIYMHRLAVMRSYAAGKVVLRGTAASDALYDKHSQLSFDLTGAEVVSPSHMHLVGTFGISGFGEPMVYKGDRVEVVGKIYPTRGAHVASLSFADISVTGHHSTPIDTVRRHFTAGIYSALPEPLGSFALGLLVGMRSTIPKDISDQLSIVGLTHIVAVSGYNLTIIIAAVRRIAGKRSKFQSLCWSLALIAGFLAITGLSASIVRAAIISTLSLLAWYYGRKLKPLLMISFTAALTALWNPLYLWSDIGWYLSFLAFFGVIVIAPLLTRRFAREGHEPNALVALLGETIAAQVMALPIIMYIFGQVSLISLVSNVLVVPFVPLGMLLSFVAGTAGALIPSVAGWLAWPARMLLTYMLDTIGLFARIPFALYETVLTLTGMIIMYVCVVLLIFALWRREKRKADIITEVEKPNIENNYVGTFQVVNHQAPKSSY